MSTKKYYGIIKWYRFDRTGYITSKDFPTSIYIDSSSSPAKFKRGDQVTFKVKNVLGRLVGIEVSHVRL